MIDRSRFPGDSGAARYRQIAFVNCLAGEAAVGRRPTIHGLAQSVGSHPSQLALLSKAMKSRGVVDRIHVPGVTKSRVGKVLFLRDDAIEALNESHIRTVGAALLPRQDTEKGSETIEAP